MVDYLEDLVCLLVISHCQSFTRAGSAFISAQISSRNVLVILIMYLCSSKPLTG